MNRNTTLAFFIISFSIIFGGCFNTSSEDFTYGNILGSIKTAKQANTNIQTICDESEFEQSKRIKNETVIIGDELDVIEKGATEQQQTIQKTQKQVDRLKDRQFNFVLFLCFGGIGLGLFLMISGAPKIGLPLLGGSGGVIALIFLLNAVMAYLWIIGLCLSFILAGCVLYFGYLLIIKNNAVKELITSVEIVKKEKDINTIKKELNTLQSKQTKQTVDKIKKQ